MLTEDDDLGGNLMNWFMYVCDSCMCVRVHRLIYCGCTQSKARDTIQSEGYTHRERQTHAHRKHNTYKCV
jgi:hypothetical protein